MAQHNPSSKMTDSYFMGLALREAQKAQGRGEVPVGAVLVLDSQVFTFQSNEREFQQNPLAHAEILAIEHAAEVLGKWRLSQSILYVTVEPCLLCSGAIYLSRISRVVYGCPNPKGGALRFVQKNQKSLNVNHSVQITSGIRELECAQLLRSFFQKRRVEHQRDSQRERA